MTPIQKAKEIAEEKYPYPELNPEINNTLARFRIDALREGYAAALLSGEDWKEDKLLDDGQEGKGLRWVKANERLPKDENYPDNHGKYYVRAVANGFRDHVRLDFLKKHPSWYEWLDESAALQVADGEGQKVAVTQLLANAKHKRDLLFSALNSYDKRITIRVAALAFIKAFDELSI